MKTVVLVGVQNDCVLQYYARYLRARGTPALFINQNRLGQDIHLDSRAFYFPENHSLGHEQISGVLNRSLAIDPRQVNEGTRCAMEILYDWMDWVQPNVINRPQHTLSNWSKPYQISQALPSVFEVPSSVVVRARAHPPFSHEMIYKSISSTRSIVVKLQPVDRHRPVDEPVLFQQYIPGDQVRVHVVCERVVGVRIETQAVDYRYAGTEPHIELIDLQPSIEQACLRVAKALQLDFVGMDFIVYQGKYYYLETNPSPGYSYFEQTLGATPISDRLTEQLSAKEG